MVKVRPAVSPWPAWLDEVPIFAKSEDMGGETLAEHTWQVLSRLSDQHRLHPDLPQTLGQPRLWTRLYWGCLLHDFGKAALEFQQVLKGEKPLWSSFKQRHETLSLGFVDWLFPKGHLDRDWVIATIAFHHKDAAIIHEKYGGDKSFQALLPQEAADIQSLLEHLDAQIHHETREHLWRWLDQCGERWAAILNLPLPEIPMLLPLEQAQKTNIRVSIFRALQDYARWCKALTADEKRAAAIYRGLILTADHAASAGARAFPDMPLTRNHAMQPLIAKGYALSHHQTEADTGEEGSAILIAPTGSGKTEAALLWAARQRQHRPAARLFYTLPYQASMNAMAERIAEKHFGFPFSAPENQTVVIQHSRAKLKFYQDMMEADSGAAGDSYSAAKAAAARKDLARLNYFPIQVFSPYQMLKAAYSLKGYETLLVDYTNALFIFDEIHAYEPRRLALIITMIGWLAKYYGARFLIMTATLPPTVLKALKSALPNCEAITADQATFEASKRHTVYLEAGDVLHQLDRIAAEYRSGNAVLLCCNTVKRAQAAYKQLKAVNGFAPLVRTTDEQIAGDILLLHGRFNGRDRSAKERLLAESVGVGLSMRHPCIIVATQVVEVSLNIDLDTLYSDPAPVDALLQRFGRVNRGRGENSPCLPVHVFDAPLGETECKPYDYPLVEAALNILKARGNGADIDESRVSEMLQHIYQGELADKWREDYRKAAADFETAVLGQMQPFQSADMALYELFYKQFDGTQVLPLDCLDDYHDAIEAKRFLDAQQYLVNVSWGQHGQMKKAGLVLGRGENEFADHVDVPYSEEWGLDITEGIARKNGTSFEDDDV